MWFIQSGWWSYLFMFNKYYRFWRKWVWSVLRIFLNIIEIPLLWKKERHFHKNFLNGTINCVTMLIQYVYWGLIKYDYIVHFKFLTSVFLLPYSLISSVSQHKLHCSIHKAKLYSFICPDPPPPNRWTLSPRAQLTWTSAQRYMMLKLTLPISTVWLWWRMKAVSTSKEPPRRSHKGMKGWRDGMYGRNEKET